MLEIFLSYSTLVFDQILLLYYLGFKRNKHTRKFYYVAIPMMMPEILKFVDFTKTQKSRYLLVNETLLFLQIKKFITSTSSAALRQKIVLQQR